jgi:hypothetical protein
MADIRINFYYTANYTRIQHATHYDLSTGKAGD